MMIFHHNGESTILYQSISTQTNDSSVTYLKNVTSLKNKHNYGEKFHQTNIHGRDLPSI